MCELCNICTESCNALVIKASHLYGAIKMPWYMPELSGASTIILKLR